MLWLKDEIGYYFIFFGIGSIIPFSSDPML